MKGILRLCIACVLAVAFIWQPSIAADLPDVSLPGMKVVSADWNGLYVGAHAGYAWRNHKLNGSHPLLRARAEIDPEGFFSGGNIGVNWKPANSPLMLGVFGDFTFADSDIAVRNISITQGDKHKTLPVKGATVTDGNSYLIAAKIGVLLTPDFMAYALSGYGWQDVDYAYMNETREHTFDHWVIGMGAEKKLTANTSLGFEVQHWLASKDTIYNDGVIIKDERQDTRVLGRLNWRIGN